MRLAIIIPVYNVRDTLDRCISSVASQSYTDWEMILVDDGSTDGSGSLCNKWASSDTRIRCIHQSNGGLSAARNTAIDACWQQSEYITFVDSDDYIEEGTLMQLMDNLAAHPEYDMLEYPVSVFEGSERAYMQTFKDHVFTAPERYWLDAYQHTYAWNKIYRAKLFRNVRFPVGLIFEDAWTLPHLLLNCKCIATTPCGLYHYMANPTGITSKANTSAVQMEQLLKAQLKALVTLNIDIKSKERDIQRLYLSLLNIQITTNRLHGSWILPWRSLSLRAGRTLRDYIKILLNNFHVINRL